MTTVYDREQFLMRCWTKTGFLAPVCAEIGVLRGEFSLMINDILKPYELHLIDPFKVGQTTYGEGVGFLPVAYSTDEDFEIVSEKVKDKGTFFIHRTKSTIAVDSFPDQTFDFIYHDASHLYEDLKRDLTEWLPKLKPGGLMCGHDYTNQPSFGVIPAVDEFCEEQNFEMIIYNQNGGDYALRAIQ